MANGAYKLPHTHLFRAAFVWYTGNSPSTSMESFYLVPLLSFFQDMVLIIQDSILINAPIVLIIKLLLFTCSYQLELFLYVAVKTPLQWQTTATLEGQNSRYTYTKSAEV